MISKFKTNKNSFLMKMLHCVIAFTFLFNLILPSSICFAQMELTPIGLPIAGTMVMPTLTFEPALIKGITIHPENPLQFDFIVNTGDSDLKGQELITESTKMIKYFLASLTVPEKEMWVNLSPYEKGRIIPDTFGATEMGRDLLSQDYMLKQLTASIMNPEKDLGKEFWQRVYEKTRQEFNTTDVPLNTFNKIWIVPSKAVVFEKDNNAVVLESHLKVMLEEDYLAMSHQNDGVVSNRNPVEEGLKPSPTTKDLSISTNIIREIIIPEIEKEVNTGKTFSNLRQIYNAVILASWFKDNLKESLLGQVYVNKNKTKGVETDDKQINQKIYDQYLEAFKKGVYNYIKEDYDPATQSVIPRKYFSGGVSDFAVLSQGLREDVNAANVTEEQIKAITEGTGSDFAMTANLYEDTVHVGSLLEDYFASLKLEELMEFNKPTKIYYAAQKGQSTVINYNDTPYNVVIKYDEIKGGSVVQLSDRSENKEVSEFFLPMIDIANSNIDVIRKSLQLFRGLGHNNSLKDKTILNEFAKDIVSLFYKDGFYGNEQISLSEVLRSPDGELTYNYERFIVLESMVKAGILVRQDWNYGLSSDVKDVFVAIDKAETEYIESYGRYPILDKLEEGDYNLQIFAKKISKYLPDELKKEDMHQLLTRTHGYQFMGSYYLKNRSSDSAMLSEGAKNAILSVISRNLGLNAQDQKEQDLNDGRIKSALNRYGVINEGIIFNAIKNLRAYQRHTETAIIEFLDNMSDILSQVTVSPVPVRISDNAMVSNSLRSVDHKFEKTLLQPVLAGSRDNVGTFMPPSLARSEEGWGITDFFLMKKVTYLNALLGQRLTQILPLNPSTYGNSPYSVHSYRMIDAIYSSIDYIILEMKTIGFDTTDIDAFYSQHEDEIESLNESDTVQYDRIRELKMQALRIIWNSILSQPEPAKNIVKDFEAYKERNKSWLSDHVLYGIIKNSKIKEELENGVYPTDLRMWDWRSWGELSDKNNTAAINEAKQKYKDDIEFESFVQYTLRRQYNDLRKDAIDKGGDIIIDIPFGVDGADIWLNPEVFGLKKENGYKASVKMGVPAERAYPAGQYWQFFAFDWSNKNTIPFLLDRYKYFQSMSGQTRLDHVLGYYRQYKFLEDINGEMSLEKLGLFDEINQIKVNALAVGSEDAKWGAVSQINNLIVQKLLAMKDNVPDVLQSTLPENAIKLTMDENGKMLPNNMLMIARQVPAEQLGEKLPDNSKWKREEVVEKKVFNGQPKWDFIRLTPNAELDDQGFLYDYIFGGEIQSADSLRLAYFELGPGEALMSEYLRLSQEQGTPLIWETLGVVPSEIVDSEAELDAFGFMPMIWGEVSNWGEKINPYHVSNHRENGFVTYSLHDSVPMKVRWEKELDQTTKTNMLNEAFGENGWSYDDLDTLTLKVRTMLLLQLHKSQGKMRVVSWLDYLGLGEEYRLNSPGVQNGQWTVRLPKSASIEKLIAAAEGKTEKSSPTAVEAVVLIKDVTQAGLNVQNTKSSESNILNVTPAVGGKVRQVRRVGEPFQVDVVINGTPEEVTLVTTDYRGEESSKRLSMTQIEIDESSLKLGIPATYTKWGIQLSADEVGKYSFRIEFKINNEIEVSEQGTLIAVENDADLNPLSSNFRLNKTFQQINENDVNVDAAMISERMIEDQKEEISANVMAYIVNGNSRELLKKKIYSSIIALSNDQVFTDDQETVQISIKNLEDIVLKPGVDENLLLDATVALFALVTDQESPDSSAIRNRILYSRDSQVKLRDRLSNGNKKKSDLLVSLNMTDYVTLAKEVMKDSLLQAAYDEVLPNKEQDFAMLSNDEISQVRRYMEESLTKNLAPNIMTNYLKKYYGLSDKSISKILATRRTALMSGDDFGQLNKRLNYGSALVNNVLNNVVVIRSANKAADSAMLAEETSSVILWLSGKEDNKDDFLKVVGFNDFNRMVLLFERVDGVRGPTSKELNVLRQLLSEFLSKKSSVEMFVERPGQSHGLFDESAMIEGDPILRYGLRYKMEPMFYGVASMFPSLFHSFITLNTEANLKLLSENFKQWVNEKEKRIQSDSAMIALSNEAKEEILFAITKGFAASSVSDQNKIIEGMLKEYNVAGRDIDRIIRMAWGPRRSGEINDPDKMEIFLSNIKNQLDLVNVTNDESGKSEIARIFEKKPGISADFAMTTIKKFQQDLTSAISIDIKSDGKGPEYGVVVEQRPVFIDGGFVYIIKNYYDYKVDKKKLIEIFNDENFVEENFKQLVQKIGESLKLETQKPDYILGKLFYLSLDRIKKGGFQALGANDGGWTLYGQLDIPTLVKILTEDSLGEQMAKKAGFEIDSALTEERISNLESVVNSADIAELRELLHSLSAASEIGDVSLNPQTEQILETAGRNAGIFILRLDDDNVQDWKQLYEFLQENKGLEMISKRINNVGGINLDRSIVEERISNLEAVINSADIAELRELLHSLSAASEIGDVLLNPQTEQILETAGRNAGIFILRLDDDNVQDWKQLYEFLQENKGLEMISKRINDVGGINLDRSMLDLQIKRDGNGVALPIDQQIIENLNIEGFIPVIINVTPIASLPILLGLNNEQLPKPIKTADSNSIETNDLSVFDLSLKG